MNAIDAEYSLDDESEVDETRWETRWEFEATIRPQFKDAYEFGRACRSLAVPVKRREEFAVV